MLRPARGNDIEWLVELRAEVLRADLTRLGRFDEHRVRERMRAGWAPERTRIIQSGGTDIGSIAVRWEAGVAWLEHFYLRPTMQNQGMGAAVLRLVLAEIAPYEVRLNVLQGSRVRGLYERMGFVVDSEDAVDVYMVRHPS